MSRDRFNEFQSAASRRPPTQFMPLAAGQRRGNHMEMGQMPHGGAAHGTAAGGRAGERRQGYEQITAYEGANGRGGHPWDRATGTAAGGGGGGGSQSVSAAFFAKLAETRDTIREINDALQQIDYLHRKHLDALTGAQSQQSEQRLDALISQTTGISTTARNHITALNEMIRSMTPDEAQPARTQLQAVKQKFMNTMTEFQGMESKYRNVMRGRLERQVRIVKPEATQEEVERMMSSDQGAHVFAQSVLHSNPYAQAQDALREVQERHEDIKKIEKTILELHQLFQDMAMLVEAQSEVVQQVATQAEAAEQYTEQATKEVDQAIEIRKRTRKKLWFLCILVVVLVVIVLVIVYTQVIAPWLNTPNPFAGNSNGNDDNNRNGATGGVNPASGAPTNETSTPEGGGGDAAGGGNGAVEAPPDETS